MTKAFIVARDGTDKPPWLLVAPGRKEEEDSGMGRRESERECVCVCVCMCVYDTCKSCDCYYSHICTRTYSPSRV